MADKDQKASSDLSLGQDRAVPARSGQQNKSTKHKPVYKHGGRREGAGRKPNEIARITRTLKVLPETSEAINSLAIDKKSYGSVVDRAVKLLLDKE